MHGHEELIKKFKTHHLGSLSVLLVLLPVDVLLRVDMVEYFPPSPLTSLSPLVASRGGLSVAGGGAFLATLFFASKYATCLFQKLF